MAIPFESVLGRTTQDVRFGVRALGRTPGFTVAVIAILALGIGGSAAMFTVYKTVLVDRLPVVAQDRLVVMHPLDRGGTHLDAPYPYLKEIARDSALFRGLAGVYHLGALPVPLMDRGNAIELAVSSASANFFDVLGTRPYLGRLFRVEDGQPGAPPVIVLSYAAWRRRFGGDTTAIGRTMMMPYTEKLARIVGVAPPGLEYPDGTDAWDALAPDFTAQVDIIARLRQGITIDAARVGLLALMQRVDAFADRFTGAPPAPKRPSLTVEIAGVEARSFANAVVGSSRPAIVALTLAVALLLVIACVNVGNLVLVRLLGRNREIAIRRAIGASHADISRLFLIENGLLGLGGGLVGAFAAAALIRVVQAAAPAQLPRADALGAVSAALAAAEMTLLAMALFALAPSLSASRLSSYAALRADSRTGTEGRAKRRVRRWLVSSQMALAIVLLAGAALLVRTLDRLESMDLGYQPEHLSVLSFTGPQRLLATNAQIFEAAKQLLARVRATPGVIAATPIESMPFKGESFFIMKVARSERPPSEWEHTPFVPWEFVGDDYFRTFDVPIRQGRSFRASDTKGADKVVVVSEALARRLWPAENPIGKTVRAGAEESTYTVVGIAADTHFRELRAVAPVVYFDWDQVEPFWNGLIAVRTSRPVQSILPALRAATRDVNRGLVLYDATTMDQLLDRPLAQPRLSALLLAAFSVVALLLSAIGLYGVMASAVRHQTRDIGVRVALGATPADVRRLVLGDAGRVVGIGALVGVAGALLGGRLLASQLFDVSPTDPVSVVGAALLLVAIGICAAYVPARRATRIDPVSALRAE